MEYNLERRKLPTKPNNLSNPEEKARLLRQYQGIFPNNIVGFAKTIIPKFKRMKNHSR